MKAGTHLEKILSKGLFAVTAEFSPPQGNEARLMKQKADLLKGYVDAINVPDNPIAHVRMSSMACSSLLLQMGLEPVMHLSTRDRNRIALQSDAFGASALGIRNILCLSGDHQSRGNQADSKNVYDLDSIQWIDCLRNLRDQGTLLGGEEKLEGKIDLFIGATENPFGDPPEFRLLRLAKKAAAGVDFIQTHYVYDMDRFKKWMNMVCERGLHEKVPILAGLCPLQSEERILWMKRKIPGLVLPDEIMDRIVKSENPAKEGIELCLEQIAQLKEIKGVRGIHLMTLDWEEAIPKIMEGAGLLPRPKALEP